MAKFLTGADRLILREISMRLQSEALRIADILGDADVKPIRSGMFNDLQQARICFDQISKCNEGTFVHNLPTQKGNSA